MKPGTIKDRNELVENNKEMKNEEEAVHRKIIYIEYLSIFLTISCLILTTSKLFFNYLMIK